MHTRIFCAAFFLSNFNFKLHKLWRNDAFENLQDFFWWQKINAKYPTWNWQHFNCQYRMVTIIITWFSVHFSIFYFRHSVNKGRKVFFSFFIDISFRFFSLKAHWVFDHTSSSKNGYLFALCKFFSRPTNQVPFSIMVKFPI